MSESLETEDERVPNTPGPKGPMQLYVGTYTGGESEGIYVFGYDPARGRLTPQGAVPCRPNPSFLAAHPRGTHLYAVNEAGEIDGEPGGAVSAFRRDPVTGRLTFLGKRSTLGPGPCHLTLDQTGRYVLVANYSGGSVAVLPIDREGRLGEACDFHQHRGASVDPERQEGPHAHSIHLDPGGRYALVCDLGLDQVLVYRFDGDRGKLMPARTPYVRTEPGAGPRHLEFHPNGRFVYVINELDSTITAYRWDQGEGALSAIETVSTLPAGFAGSNTCADVHVHPNGRFVYGSNRGHDSIAVFRFHPDTGGLTPLGHVSSSGRTPRNFTLDPSGRFLLSANQDSDSIATFEVDLETGSLTPTGSRVTAPKPVCLCFPV